VARTTKRGKDRPAWAKLTWDDLTEWAGSRSVERGRTYQRGGRVRDLAVSDDGALLAWVQGTHRYATTVELGPRGAGDDRLQSRCTCPVGVACKHAVAVVLAYLEALRQQTPVPQADPDDRRWDLLSEEYSEDDEFEDEEDEEDEEGDEDEDEYAEEEEPRPRRRSSRGRGAGKADLRAFLQARSTEELVDLVAGLAQRYPEVAEELRERAALGAGRMDELVRRARREIDELTSEPAWENHWSGEGEIPDYSGLERRLEQLLEHGQADAVLDLGRRLLEKGLTQVEESHDEGETASGIARCLDVVFRAVPRSSLPNPKKLLYVIDACLQDDYDLIQEVDEVLSGPWSQADWSAVADELARRLAKLRRPGAEFHDRYRRDRLSNWLVDALEKAGREDEALALCEAEAPITHSYDRLVRRLVAARRLDDAVRWATEGIQKTAAEWPGIANSLRGQLREIAQSRRDWPLVAAHRAEEFFDRPSVEGYRTLLKAAAKAGCEEQVRAGALQFLETGKPPTPAGPAQAVGKGRKPKAASKQGAWPLPTLPRPEPSRRRGFTPEPGPHLGVLLDLAIAEKRPDDVLAVYDRLRASRGNTYWGGYGGEDERVADAVAATHPDRALAIYRKHAEGLIAQTNVSAYEEAARYLRKARKVLHKLGRDAEWDRLVATIREQNARKRRLLEVLDGLTGRPIIEG
jgi:uncharacterized Zn finger protein